MKKIYISPTMDVIELKHQQVLLAGSGPDTMNVFDETLGGSDEVLAPEHEWYEWRF